MLELLKKFLSENGVQIPDGANTKQILAIIGAFLDADTNNQDTQQTPENTTQGAA
ncbi:UNVERIFIED_CONTAM: hypothetical protein RF648_19470 [Kocuria sp. CPCC 205274]|uniref:Phage holin n=1 Tax=Herbiconiux daphne TaxID=2970914 RepID=A0ABT2H925_9MICO|nr:hypothetical protein [Herbiconiux daphne]MCS5736456.1 hypothetical protein [Herbiconiux daphne]